MIQAIRDMLVGMRCSKCKAKFEAHHHIHVGRKGMYHTSCYNAVIHKEGG